MATDSPREITALLLAWSGGDRQALDRLIPLVEAELHRLAARYIRRERPGHTLQTTALVNEAYLRLVDWQTVRWENRAHFFGVSAQLMRRILVDHARRENYLKRGGGALQVSLGEAEAKTAEERGVDLLALDEALDKLARFDERKSRMVELRFFAGLSVEETAEVLKVSPRTVKREWAFAQAWLHNELRG
jgi:RNA polymerase sigma-70 factor, ECF subfamily